jgi:membrane-bound lytic murein transglycosylase B
MRERRPDAGRAASQIVGVAACAVVLFVWPGQAVAARPQSTSSPQSAAPGASSRADGDRPPFDEWLAALRAEAAARGISDRTLDAALGGLEPLPIVVRRDRSQAEFTFTLDAYVRRRLRPKLIRDTKRQYRAHKALLERVARKYEVPAPIITSVWALESDLGRFSGVRPTIATLATLAWDGRRPFFRLELLDALTILENGDIEPGRMKGSWAGAMGQVQFMPSSYLKYAQDFDEDGRKDVWTSRADVFASIANYLKQNGWRAGETWGREVQASSDVLEAALLEAPLATDGCRAERELTRPLPLARWHALGLRTATGRTLPKADIEASFLPSGDRGFLVYPNYLALLRYNCANPYAVSVGTLADRLAGR